jgi:hypothetical protein
MLAVVCTTGAANPQSDFRAAIDIPAVLKQLGSKVDTLRANALYSLLWEPSSGAYDPAARTTHLLATQPKLRARIGAALIRTLERENGTLLARAAYALPAPYTQYYPHLVASVGALNDRTAVRALVGGLRSGAADEGLVAIGVPALPALRLAARDKEPVVRDAAKRVIARIELKMPR